MVLFTPIRKFLIRFVPEHTPKGMVYPVVSNNKFKLGVKLFQCASGHDNRIVMYDNEITCNTLCGHEYKCKYFG